MFIAFFSSCRRALDRSRYATITSAVTTTTTINSVCHECGTIRRSGKISCCGPGGSWFGNCTSVGNAHFGHTWHAGIQACKARQSQVAVSQHLHASLENPSVASGSASVDVNSKDVTPMAVPTSNISIITLDSKSMAYNTSTITSKEFAAARSTNIRTSANMPILKASSNRVTRWATPIITPQVNARIIPIVNLAIIKSMRSALADISTTTSPQESDSASIIVRELKQSPCVVIYISMMFILFCWY